jgi:hypothetical protein
MASHRLQHSIISIKIYTLKSWANITKCDNVTMYAATSVGVFKQRFTKHCSDCCSCKHLIVFMVCQQSKCTHALATRAV